MLVKRGLFLPFGISKQQKNRWLNLCKAFAAIKNNTDCTGSFGDKTTKGIYNVRKVGTINRNKTSKGRNG